MARKTVMRWRLYASYFFDYAIIVVLIVASGVIGLLEPHYSAFSLEDKSLQYPLLEQTVTSGTLAAVALIAPAAIMAAWTLLLDKYLYPNVPAQRRLWELNCALLGLGLSIMLTLLITSSIKNIVGRPRPDAIARCMPRAGATDPPFMLSTVADVCTNPDKAVVMEGWRSFPSGHSSTAFAGLAYLAFFLGGRVRVLDNRGEVWKAALTLAPLLLAVVIACTRIMDKWHHGTDVLAGSLLGLATAWVAYRQYYPSLADVDKAGRAWDLRSWGSVRADYVPSSAASSMLGYDQLDEEAQVEGSYAGSRRRTPGLLDGAE
ncbi:phosphatidic acid phosphatase type 2/haloperoxidase [Dipodascopsis tothii]|uniref:phosphatidic acid phosphatase type 2/haloperoxidase n=1 Tax=Dipodascopsis tothii TaxID=44089 RepID=UPI0034CF4F6C